MGKLQKISGIVHLLINKVPGIRTELVISDDNWQELNIQGFVENLQKWRERSHVVSREE